MRDQNTVFFHNFVTQRKKRNIIKILEYERGGWVEGDNAINELATNFFQNPFSSNPLQSGERLRSKIQLCITESLNEKLIREFKEEEVVEALKSKSPLKASGKDGYPTFFYQKFWHIIVKNVVNYCLQILNNGKNFEEINKTNIVLILKVQAPTNL
ncbi:hypothetical protein J1N35_026588 [Gossypium stocksii]|uniref:Reverse transcriptase domain-containing protein n=1 Tax=Gossypium stocksii TaxID=47602 RepID=A0A9D3V952_9ROSI|nr:hypothetical protein J1N35_026588 [Gossypium stocksii]